MNKFFQVSANTLEPEAMKVRKCNGCHGRRMTLYMTVREYKVDHEGLQQGHERKPSEESIGMEVGGWVVHEETECDKAHGTREQSRFSRKGKSKQREVA